HRGNPYYRFVFVHRPDRIAHSRSKFRRIPMRAHHDRLRMIEPGPVCVRDVKGIAVTHRQRLLLYIAQDADNGGPRPIRMSCIETYANPLTDRISTGEFSIRECFADQHHHWSTGPVVLVEKTSSPQRNMHRLDIPRAHRIAKHRFSNGIVLPVEFHAIHISLSS